MKRNAEKITKNKQIRGRRTQLIRDLTEAGRTNEINVNICDGCGYRIRGVNHLEGQHHVDNAPKEVEVVT